jgi:hypothetical protein
LYSVRRASARSLLPALLTGLQHFVEVAGGTNLEDGAVFEGGMLGYELVSMIHVAGFEDENAAELFLRRKDRPSWRLCRSSNRGLRRFRQAESVLHRPSGRWRGDGRRR